jgi:hypothetical protein
MFDVDTGALASHSPDHPLPLKILNRNKPDVHRTCTQRPVCRPSATTTKYQQRFSRANLLRRILQNQNSHTQATSPQKL